MAIPGVRKKLRHFNSHTLTGLSFKILNVCLVLKNHEPVHAKHDKCIFEPQCEYSRVRTKKLGFYTAERKSDCSDNKLDTKVFR